MNEREGSVFRIRRSSCLVYRGEGADTAVRCPRIGAIFANGQKVDLANGQPNLRTRQMTNYDLPRIYRKLLRVNMTRRVIYHRNVAIQKHARS
jgi:hypothetical protein